ncbi:HopJ type III effector protein [Marinobacterium jannaschii]|uniref:HopJ type III effector protein n=1 Tax=Marinobacterium jannaschii TaxID=64970 RepID=UPI0006849E96|nr:HopJ type III effector protein [Marinobacterium jannaschii]
MTSLAAFLEGIGSDSTLDFEDCMQVISDHYVYSQTGFQNGDLRNEAGQNEGSCKIFAFAQLNNLNKDKTLACFGRFYQDVLNTPEGNDHGNIRNFINTGWDGIAFDSAALTAR